MSFEFNDSVKKRLSMSLPRIAEEYFNGNMHEVSKIFGICFNNEEMYKKIGFDTDHAYPDVSAVLYTELKFKEHINLERVAPTPQNWEQRAIMCLLMAEYLKGL
jgi:hypothetical protein